MQLGFVIDHSRCIGCHACTVACKAENDVPVGRFRTWVKYTEKGEFPEVRRSFAVLRCNQCTSAPCVTICPVSALKKRDDGIVDVDPAACIGCKACMQGCPYDALYLNEGTGTAEKCHFCAHRTEQGLAPACAVVCPTEAIIPGDFHDEESVVSKLRFEHDLKARKTEAGTGPNVFYREVAEAGIAPLQTEGSGGYLWADRLPGPRLDAETEASLENRAEARTTYDIERATYWGGKISTYLFAKAVAAGAFLVGGFRLAPWRSAADVKPMDAWGVPGLALAFLTLTLLVLVADLKRPERFLYILLRPNWDSWLARGSFILAGYAAALTAWLGLGVLGKQPPTALAWPLWIVTAVLAFLSAAYTGWLFAQAKGRVLWMRRGLWLQLGVKALLAGAAVMLLWVLATGGLGDSGLRVTWAFLAVSLLAHLIFMRLEGRLAPARREDEHAAVHALLRSAPWKGRHLWGSTVVGVIAPAVLLLLPTPAWGLAAVLVLIGLFIEEDLLVRVGQALPIS
ncbi:MAG: 4Fe-4S dicluster domain-containing protein [Acidobacteriota bacterium]